MKNNYTPEVAIAAILCIRVVSIFVVVVWGVVTLYEMSGSWHSLWLLLMLLVMPSYSFKRDDQNKDDDVLNSSY